MKAFEDTSIFQGITQYFDNDGIEWRRKDENVYYFYKNIDGSFVYVGSLVTDLIDTEEVHELFCETVNNEEEFND